MYALRRAIVAFLLGALIFGAPVVVAAPPTPTLAQVLASGNVMTNQQITLRSDGVNVGRIVVHDATQGGAIVIERFHEDGSPGLASVSLTSGGRISLINSTWAEVAVENDGDVYIATGGGTNFRLRADGLLLAVLPTTDPAVPGALWNDNGTVKVSAG